MILCNECGNELNNTAKFCRNCGAKIDAKNAEVVEGSGSAAINRQIEETAGEVATAEAGTVETYFFDYLDFFKETLLHPSSVFRGGYTDWILGAISVGLFAIISAIISEEPFASSIVTALITEAVFVGILFLLNKYLLGGQDTYTDALGKYGGLINSQIILSLVLALVGVDSGFGAFLFFVVLINQLNIFNLYVLNSQSNVQHKLDRYYQLLVSYIPFIILAYLALGNTL